MEPSRIPLPSCLTALCCAPAVPCESFFIDGITPRGFKIRLNGTDWVNNGVSPSVGPFCDPNCNYYHNREFYLRQCKEIYSSSNYPCYYLTKFRPCDYYDTVGIGNPGYDGPHYEPYVNNVAYIIAGFFTETGTPFGTFFGVYLVQNHGPNEDCRVQDAFPVNPYYWLYKKFCNFDIDGNPIPSVASYYEVVGEEVNDINGPCITTGGTVTVDVEAVM